jgi:hypothetical protein
MLVVARLTFKAVFYLPTYATFSAIFIKVTQSGQRRYAQLVESFRNEEGNARQRTACSLGRLEAGGEVDTLIASLQRLRGIAPTASALDGLRFPGSRQAGDISALSELWHSLGFDDLVTSWRRSKTEVDVLTCRRRLNIAPPI